MYPPKFFEPECRTFVSKLYNHWFRWWLVICKAPNHKLNKCCLVFAKFSWNSIFSIDEIAIQNVYKWQQCCQVLELKCEAMSSPICIICMRGLHYNVGYLNDKCKLGMRGTLLWEGFSLRQIHIKIWKTSILSQLWFSMFMFDHHYGGMRNHKCEIYLRFQMFRNEFFSATFIPTCLFNGYDMSIKVNRTVIR